IETARITGHLSLQSPALWHEPLGLGTLPAKTVRAVVQVITWQGSQGPASQTTGSPFSLLHAAVGLPGGAFCIFPNEFHLPDESGNRKLTHYTKRTGIEESRSSFDPQEGGGLASRPVREKGLCEPQRAPGGGID